MTPALSVLIDTHNHEKYIEQAIVSAIEQDFPAADYEILVVDDGSTDRTPDIVRKFAPIVRLLQKRNGGQASAFNAGVPETRGEVVAFLDGDDWFAPGKLTAVAKALQQHPEAAAVGHGHYEFKEQTEGVKTYAPPACGFFNLATVQAAREALGSMRSLLIGALTARKRLLERILPISEQLVFCADTPVQFGLMAHGFVALPDPLFYYRRHRSNLYSNVAHRQNPMVMREKIQVHQRALEDSLRVLIRQGVPSEIARNMVWPSWVQDSRTLLAMFGGNPLETLRTEIRAFSFANRNATGAHRALMCALIAAATLPVTPRLYYGIRNRRPLSRSWYYLLESTYRLRHAIGLCRNRTAQVRAGSAK